MEKQVGSCNLSEVSLGAAIAFFQEFSLKLCARLL